MITVPHNSTFLAESNKLFWLFHSGRGELGGGNSPRDRFGASI